MNFLILPNQLFEEKFLNKKIEIVLWECPHFFIDYTYNKKKLMLHRATMKCYFDYLIEKGYKVKYVEYQEYIERDIEYIMYNPLNKISILNLPPKVKILESPNLLLSDQMRSDYRKKTKNFFFNAFYEWSKKQLNIIPGIKSQDKLNRSKPKEILKIKQPFKYCSNKYIEEAKNYVEKNFPNNYGNVEKLMYPVSFFETKRWLRLFLKEKFNNFGIYQDYIDKDDKFLYHSLLSALINIGLLQPKDIIKECLRYYGKVPLNSLEGFIRQLFWREYQFYCYEYFDFKGNFFGNTKKISKDWYQGTLNIEPVDNAIKEAFDIGYLHHIKRLMVIGNYMNISGINPKDGFRWFMEFSCDSYEWVMFQNVYEMVFCISGGKTMRRPYISSSNYILKMSNYQKGPWCDKWNSLYKSFVKKHKKKMKKFGYFYSY